MTQSTPRPTNLAGTLFGPRAPWRLVAAGAALLLASCAATQVRTFGSPEEATVAIIESAGSGDQAEASRIFDTFAKSSVQRDQVYASLYGAASGRYAEGAGVEAANILEFVAAKYPRAVAAREARVLALFVERAESGATPTGEDVKALDASIRDVRSLTEAPAAWVELAATQVAIDRGELDRARDTFTRFLGIWDGQAASLGPYVEDIDRYLRSH